LNNPFSRFEKLTFEQLAPNNFCIKRKIFDPFYILLAIATNIPVRLVTGFVIQGHRCLCFCTHVRGSAASAAAAGRVQWLQFADHFLQLTNQLLLGGGV